MAKVQFKYGTFARFQAVTKDPDTLYFITDKGVFYKGDQPYVGVVKAEVTSSGEGENSVAVMTLTDSMGATVTFSVPNATALAAVKTALEESLSIHDAQTGNSSRKGHVKLSDSISSTSGVSGGIAATPKAVKDAYDALIQIINNAFAANDAMVFKGVLGDKNNDSIQSLPTEGFSAGWTYRVGAGEAYVYGEHCEVGDMIVAIKDYDPNHTPSTPIAQGAGDPYYWTVIQANIDGAVVAPSNLATDQLVVGSGNNKTVKKLAAGNDGQILQMRDGKPTWTDIEDKDEKVTVEDTGSADMYIIGATSQTGNQKGKSKSTLKLTGGNKLEAPYFKGDGSEITNLDPTNLSGNVPVSKGGTGSNTAAGARTNLGLGGAAVKEVAVSVTDSEQGLTTGAQVAGAIDDSLDDALGWGTI